MTLSYLPYVQLKDYDYPILNTSNFDLFKMTSFLKDDGYNVKQRAALVNISELINILRIT